MNHLLEYENYGDQLNEGAIPVYDEVKFAKNPKEKPDMEIKYSQVIAVVQQFLDKVESGEYENVTVIADVPTQGKRTPEYIVDLMKKERQRLAKKNYEIYGSRIEKADRPEGDDEYRDEVNVFVDSEHVIEKIIKDSDGDYMLGIPYTFYKKVQREPSLKSYYTVKIYPNQVSEVFFQPA